jgi:hypothetical protein
MESAFSVVMDNPLWEKAASQRTFAGPAPESLARIPPVIESGCPSEPAVYDPRAGPVIDGRVASNVGRVTQRASPYLFHIYVLPKEEIFRIVGSPDRFHFGAEELLCVGDECHEVTIGLYYSLEDLSDTTRVAREMEYILGLR